MSNQDNTGTVTITRVFDAPVELVWKAWTEPERVMHWWGPKMFTSPACKIDFRVGGTYHFCMKSPEGDDLWSTGIYREIIPFSKIVYSDNFADANGNIIPASSMGLEGDWSAERIVTLQFEDLGGKTRMILQHEGFPKTEIVGMANEGWNESLNKFAACLQ